MTAAKVNSDFVLACKMRLGKCNFEENLEKSINNKIGTINAVLTDLFVENS
jgi:hypothetical protein